LLLAKTLVKSNAPSLLKGYVVLCIISTTGISATLIFIWLNVNVRASQVHAFPFSCTPSHPTPCSQSEAFCRCLSLCFRFHHFRKVDHCKFA